VSNFGLKNRKFSKFFQFLKNILKILTFFLKKPPHMADWAFRGIFGPFPCRRRKFGPKKDFENFGQKRQNL
jgi:hypothetical protein